MLSHHLECLPHLRVASSAEEQLLVGPDLGDAPLMQHDDAVGGSRRLQTMRDHDRRPSVRHLPHRRRDVRLGREIEV